MKLVGRLFYTESDAIMDNLYSEDDKIADISWFMSCCEDIVKQHGYKYYAIQFQKIIGMYNSYDEAMNYIEKHNLLGKCSIQKYEESQTTYNKGVMYIWF